MVLLNVIILFLTLDVSWLFHESTSPLLCLFNEDFDNYSTMTWNPTTPVLFFKYCDLTYQVIDRHQEEIDLKNWLIRDFVFKKAEVYTICLKYRSYFKVKEMYQTKSYQT
nr:uncharacterized protein LOC124808230 [Hydra vulgaris]